MHKFPCPKCGAGDIKISPAPFLAQIYLRLPSDIRSIIMSAAAAAALAITG